MTNHTISRIQVVNGRAAMSATAEIAPAGATNQTHGALNFRGSSGSRIRSTRIPTETITKARSVPIEQRLPASRTVNTAEKKATTTPVMIEVSQGVRNLG